MNKATIPEKLAKQLRDGLIIPFAGAGVSLGVKTASGAPLYPSWSSLMEAAALALQEEGSAHAAELVRAHLAKNEWLEAGQAARDGLGVEWVNFLIEKFDPDIEHAASSHSLRIARHLWELGSPVIITTNFDRVLEHACPFPAPARGQPTDVGFLQQLALGEGRPAVFHLHGHIDSAPRVVLTTTDFQRLYPGGNTAVPEFAAAYQVLQHFLAHTPLLFVGFSFEDQQIVRTLRQVRDAGHGAVGFKHWVICHEDEEPEIRKRTDELGVLTIPVADFDKSLLELIEALADHAPKTLPRRGKSDLLRTATSPVPGADWETIGLKANRRREMLSWSRAELAKRASKLSTKPIPEDVVRQLEVGDDIGFSAFQHIAEALNWRRSNWDFPADVDPSEYDSLTDGELRSLPSRQEVVAATKHILNDAAAGDDLFQTHLFSYPLRPENDAVLSLLELDRGAMIHRLVGVSHPRDLEFGSHCLSLARRYPSNFSFVIVDLTNPGLFDRAGVSKYESNLGVHYNYLLNHTKSKAMLTFSNRRLEPPEEMRGRLGAGGSKTEYGQERSTQGLIAKNAALAMMLRLAFSTAEATWQERVGATRITTETHICGRSQNPFRFSSSEMCVSRTLRWR